MRYENIHNLQIPKIGFGTWSIGGHGSPDPTSDEHSLQALRSALELGYTHFDTAEGYAAGHAEELLGQTIRAMSIPREDLFITTKVSPDHLHHDDVLHSCEGSLRRLNMDHIDLYLIHWPSVGAKYEETFRALNKLVKDGKVRHLGVSNFNLKQLQKAVALSETPILTDQVPYCVPGREYVKNGVLGYCQANDILLTAYSPVKHRFVHGHKALMSIAAERGVSPYKVALAWLTTQPRVITIPMSEDPQHQRDNLHAADMVLTLEEMARLN
jgi:diketogulonate reductase-like aldo/keto reductase